MNDNLPEINFKEKKEQKKGVLGWLRNNMGFGSRGAIGEAGINPSAINVGRALGTAKIGTSSAGIAGLLAGKAGLIVTAALVTVAGGMYVARNTPAPSNTAGSFSSNKAPDNYVPAILRRQAANQGSSLDIFKDTNKGAGLALEGAAKPAAAKEEAPAAETAAAEPAPDGQGGNMAQEMMGKLQGGGGGSLTSSLGGGGNKFSAMGGFGNKFNSGATGGKTGFTSGIGSGFSAMPKFDARKGKLLAMKGSARPVFSNAKSGKRDKFGTGAFSQAKGMRATQKTFTGSSVDSARSTQDKAWEGSTPEGEATGGEGIGDGGAGVVTSPSLDNAGSGGGGGDSGLSQDVNDIPEVEGIKKDTPWAGFLGTMNTLLMLAALLATIGSGLVLLGESTTWAAGVGAAIILAGQIICGIAALLGAVVVVMSAIMMIKYKQAGLGALYMIGGVCATSAALMGMAGAFNMTALFNPLWMCAAAGVIGLIGGMMGGK